MGLSILAEGLVPAIGIGLFLQPPVTSAVRAFANERRRLAYEWAGVPIAIPYRPEPDRPPESLAERWRRVLALKADPAHWRDLLWLMCAPISLVLGILPVACVTYGIEGIVVAPIVGAFTGGYGYTFGWAVDFPGENLVAIPQGVLFLALGLAIAPRMQRVSAVFARSLLSPVRSEALSQRVQRLTRTRADAVDAQAAELRRLPVLILSQHVEQTYARQLLSDRTGGIGYLLKDRVSNVGEFVAAVRRVATGGTVLDPEVVAQLLTRRCQDSPVNALTAREREVLGLMAEGRSNAAIAKQLFVTEKAIAKHINNIFGKLGLPPSEDDNRRVLAVVAYLNT